MAKKMIMLIAIMLYWSITWANISGGITINTTYQPGSVMDIEFVLDLNSVDDEGACYIELTFPEGIIPTGTPVSITGNGSYLEFWGFYENYVYWGGGMGIPDLGVLAPNGDPYVFSCQAIISPMVTGTQQIGYVVAGEMMGGSHVFGGSTLMDQSMEFDMKAVSITGNDSPTVGITETYEITIENNGSMTAAAYMVELYKQAGILIGSVTGNPVAPGESITLEIDWTPELQEATYIFGKVNLVGDLNPSNDLTQNLNVFPQAQQTISVTIGEENLEDILVPYSYTFQHSLSEQIFYSHELNISGELKGLQFYHSFDLIPDDAEITIWLGETDSTNFEAGFITADHLQQVYTGVPIYQLMEGIIQFDFDTPYNYTGKNLVVLTSKVSETNFTSYWCEFYASSDLDHYGRSIMISSASNNGQPLDPNFPYLDDASLLYTYSNTTFLFNPDNIGTLTGTVKNISGEPLAGAQIFNETTGAISYTNSIGEYTIGLTESVYSFTISAYGYNDQTIDNVSILSQQTTTLDFVLDVNTTINVTGKIVDALNPDQAITGAHITLSGIGVFEAITDENGNFTVENVFSNRVYNMDAKAAGYKHNLQTIETEDSNLDLGVIELIELPYPVKSVTAVLNNDQNSVNIDWESGETEFRVDDGNMQFELGNTLTPENAVMGTAFRNHAVINSVSWLLTDLWGVHSNVNIVILELNDMGFPDSDKILYYGENIENIDNEWNSLLLPHPVESENGFMVGVNTPFQYTSLGVDDGVETPYEFESMTNFVNEDWINAPEWFDIQLFGYEINFMVRANGMDMGSIEYKDDININVAKNSGNWSLNKLTNNFEVDNSRALNSFNVYRMLEIDQNNPENWTLLGNVLDTSFVDDEISTLPSNVYIYAVEAVYDNENTSEPCFSNPINHSVGIEDSSIPSVTELNGNYPNPFNPVTTISYSLAKAGFIDISIFNSNGQLVDNLLKGNIEAGFHNVKFDASKFNSGVYYYRMSAGSKIQTKKMVLIK
ncbi:MAG: carboxypeptidase regulatory-like domain-containing protein [Candidatus Delongbacteria bacterium]|nr:carboxypeptidase regulatory-like domain-containing protein [Candidatus Delongbacteria bacterium]MBN2835794.1 carboxypeptidase regulatory-like domain-containing protein [Candidatus Delongbacteria bacterium]